jgi:hypothetical protein
LPDGATLDVYYPLGSDLKDVVSGADMTETRASKIVYPLVGSYPVQWTSKEINEAAHTGVSTLVQGAIDNKLVSTYNFTPNTSLAGFTDETNVASSAEDNTAFLQANGFADVIANGVSDGYMVKSVNSDPSLDRQFSTTNTVGNTNNHSAFFYFYSDSTDDVTLKLGPTILATVTPVIGVLYKIAFEDATPTGTGNVLGLAFSAGTTIRWFAGCLVESSVNPESIPITDGSAGTQALTDLQADSTLWSVNDYALYINIQDWQNIGSASAAIVAQNRDSPSNQWLLRNEVAAGGGISYFNAVSGVTKSVTASVSGNDSFDVVVNVDSTLGTTIETPYDSDTDATMTNGVAIPQPITQLGNNIALSTPCNCYIRHFKIITRPAGTTITLEQARKAV